MFISEAWAQTAAAAGGESFGSIAIQIGFIIAIFYILLIRPQQKKIKMHEAMLKAVKKGDKIVTGGGIYGKVVEAVEGSPDMLVEIADGVKVRISRLSVRELVVDKPVNDNSKSKK